MSEAEVALSVRGLSVRYGAAQALDGISLEVRRGEVVTIIGGNGAGKTTTLKTISGMAEMLKTSTGEVTFEGRRIDGMASNKIARLGMAHVPEGRRIFPAMTVDDNLLIGSYRRRGEAEAIASDLALAYERFPVLGERRRQMAGFLSGGEQQMLAIGRGLMARPSFLLLDEPSLGLAPILVKRMFEIIRTLAAEGTTILLVEQMARLALGVADRGYVLEQGRIVADGPSDLLLEDPRLKAAYLGG
ncbi:MAG: ABC transporter ATP-binding protein [Acidimicrobiales bacterium]